MAKPNPAVAEILSAIAPEAKRRGFKKARLTLHRRHGETVQIVNIQSSAFNAGGSASFYVNVALQFDASADPAKVKYYQCPFQARIENLFPEAIEIGDGTRDVARQKKLFAEVFAKLAKELDGIRTREDYERHEWGRRPRSLPGLPWLLEAPPPPAAAEPAELEIELACPSCDAPIAPEATKCPRCGEAV